MSGKLAGKVAIVTGAGSGIGLASAQLFAREGARVVLGDIDDAKLARAVAAIQQDGGTALGQQADVSRADQVEALVQAAVDRFGRLDVMFSNAGISARGNVVDLPPEHFDQVIAVNLRGGFLCAKYAIPHMIRAGGGSIIFTASELAIVATENAAAYCASKAGLVGMARAIALDHAPHGIRVNCLCPGPVNTPLLHGDRENPAEHEQEMIERMPVRRIGQPDELARAALFLASDDSSFVTATSLVADGGVTARW